MPLQVFARILGWLVRRVASTRTMILVALVATSAASTAGTWLYFDGATDPLSAPARGFVEAFTDDPSATVWLWAYASVRGGDSNHKLDVSVQIDSTHPHLAWALVVSGDFEFPSDGPAGGVQAVGTPPYERVLGRTWYLRRAGLGPRPVGAGAVYYAPRHPRIAATQQIHASAITGRIQSTDIHVGHSYTYAVSVVVPTEMPVVDDVGDRYAVNFPVLGSPLDTDPDAGLNEHLPGGTTRIRLDPSELDAPSEAVREISSDKWIAAPASRTMDEIRDEAYDDVLSRSFTPPETPTEWRWEGKDQLQVNAVVERPSVQSSKSREQFFGAVFLGIGGAFLVWLLDMLREAARGWVRKRDGIPPIA